MTSSDQFQAIVIGSGQGGNPLGISLAQAGFRTALIERQFVGGTCINYGCSPTKTMVASARVAYLARRGADYGIRTGDVRVDMARVRERKRGVVETFRNARLGSFKNLANFELIFGEASFTGAKTLLVLLRDGGVRELSADKIFIDAGTRPVVPAIDGLKEVPFLDSTSIMELDSLPEHLIVLGGGYVGLEFGQMFRRFGSRVTIVQSGPQLLTREDADVASAVAQILQQDGVTVLLNAKATGVTKTGAQIHVIVRVGEESHVVDGSHLLVGTGRTPNTDTLNLAAAGVATDKRGFIPVNAKLETNVPGTYALGDINGGPAFTHISYDDFRILRTNVIEKGNASTEGRLVPYTVYIDPQLGRIGLTEGQARAQNKKVRVARMPMTSVARATETGETRGFMKAVVDAGSGQILGAAVLGIEGGEIMSMLELAMMGKLTHTVLHDAIFAHPTLAESLNNLFLHFDS
jgi:pyruvate/2-oxoglutarate dehydrogenase complex dihydrolipoamide dehydrogenase (E3) component